MQKLTLIVQVIVHTFDTVYCFQYAVYIYIISTTIYYMHQLCFMYILSSTRCPKKEREAVNMQGTVLIRKVENSS